MTDKAPDAFRTISEAAEEVGVAMHVLRHWEQVIPQLQPMRRGGGRRFYRPSDVDLLVGLRTLLHDQGMTTKGVQKLLKAKGTAGIAKLGAAVRTGNTPGACEHSAEIAMPRDLLDALERELTFLKADVAKLRKSLTKPPKDDD